MKGESDGSCRGIRKIHTFMGSMEGAVPGAVSLRPSGSKDF